MDDKCLFTTCGGVGSSTGEWLHAPVFLKFPCHGLSILQGIRVVGKSGADLGQQCLQFIRCVLKQRVRLTSEQFAHSGCYNKLRLETLHQAALGILALHEEALLKARLNKKRSAGYSTSVVIGQEPRHDVRVGLPARMQLACTGNGSKEPWRPCSKDTCACARSRRQQPAPKPKRYNKLRTDRLYRGHACVPISTEQAAQSSGHSEAGAHAAMALGRGAWAAASHAWHTHLGMGEYHALPQQPQSPLQPPLPAPAAAPAASHLPPVHPVHTDTAANAALPDMLQLPAHLQDDPVLSSLHAILQRSAHTAQEAHSALLEAEGRPRADSSHPPQPRVAPPAPHQPPMASPDGLSVASRAEAQQRSASAGSASSHSDQEAHAPTRHITASSAAGDPHQAVPQHSSSGISKANPPQAAAASPVAALSAMLAPALQTATQQMGAIAGGLEEKLGGLAARLSASEAKKQSLERGLAQGSNGRGGDHKEQEAPPAHAAESKADTPTETQDAGHDNPMPSGSTTISWRRSVPSGLTAGASARSHHSATPEATPEAPQAEAASAALPVVQSTGHPALQQRSLRSTDGMTGPYSRHLQRVIAISSADPIAAAAQASWEGAGGEAANPAGAQAHQGSGLDESQSATNPDSAAGSALPLNTSAELERDFQAAVARMRLADRLACGAKAMSRRAAAQEATEEPEGKEPVAPPQPHRQVHAVPSPRQAARSTVDERKLEESTPTAQAASDEDEEQGRQHTIFGNIWA